MSRGIYKNKVKLFKIGADKEMVEKGSRSRK